ncbi:kinesin, putative [Trypanosoma brucei brucei TREU927]|uniref:Kinesin, putative n=2 Tax=Trypanozoon TaxID=39700 RepID=Q38CF1_TRYB2|nr:kinesin, putative [Trypanosoma brucei brucei TREU927]EAN77519.1 kinesin, putative [Trypanosoma brucei brucei TREU927]
MLHKPCVQVVMRFRPNPGVASPFYSTDDTGAPWLTYDERTVRVVERDPPMDRKRVEPNGGPCGDSNDPPVSKALVPAPVTSYTFDAVLSDTSTQRDVHKCVGEPVIGNVLKGYNATIFSYGQTGSGKTYTMLGPYGGLADAFFEDSPFYGERGLVPRVVEELFNRLNTMKSEEYTWRVKTQMFEIYRENIVDLLIEGDQQPQTEYRIREGKNSQGSFCMYVDSLKEVECRTAADFMDILQRGVASRHTRETGTNDRSSRSHCLLCLFVELKHNEDYSMWTESRLNFVDLAGSERVATSQAEGETLKETQYINLSLSLLGNVIHRLAGGNTGHIPYRDTKLTRVLKDSLGGNSLTTLLCHGTTEAATKSQTINTLRFAQKALRIKTRAVVNKPSKTTIKQQQQEFYKEHTKQLEKQIRVLQEIIRSRENTEGENSMCAKCESMSATIASLTKEIERLQKELIAREEQLQQTQETGDYYKKNCETLENELAKLTEEQEANDARHIEAYTILEEESENLRAEIEALQKQLAEKPHKDASNSEALSNKNNTRKNNYNDYKNRATMTDRRTHSNCCTMTDPVTIVMPDVMEDMQRRLTKELINCGTMTDIRSHSNCCTMTDPVAIVMPDVMEDMQRRLTKELINCGTMTDIRSHSNCCTMTDPVAIVMPDVMEDMQRRLTKELINCGTMTDGTISTNRATMTDCRTHSNCCTMTDPVAIVMPDVMEDMQRRLTKELINCGTMTDIRSHSNCCTMTDPVAIVMPDVMEDMQRRLTKELINCGTMTDIRSHSNCCTMTDPVAIVMPDVMEDMQRRLTKELINCGTMTDGTISTNRATMTDRRTHSNCCTMTDPVAIVMPDVMEDMQRRLTKELINCGTMTDIRSHSNCCTMTDPVAIVMPDVMEDMQRRLTKELINCGTMTDGTVSTNCATMTDLRSHSNCCTMTDPVAIVMPDVMEDMQRRLTKELINCGTMTDGTISTNRATMTDLRSHSNCCTMTDPVAIVMPDVMEDMQRRLTKELINCGTMTDGTVSTNCATMTDLRSHSNCCTMTDPVAIVMPDVMEDMQRRLTKELINCGTMTDLRSHSNCCTMTDPVAIVMPDVMEDMQRRLTKELINCGTMTDGTVSTNCATMTDIRSHSNCCTMTDPVAIVMPDVMEDMQRRLTKELINCGTMTDGTVSTNCATMTEVCRQSNSLDRRVSCVSGTAENVSLSGETFCRNTSVNTRECSYIARNTIFASSVVSSFVPVIGEGQFEWWCLDDVYAHALLFSYCNPRDVGINIGLFDDCDDKVLLQSLGVVHRTLGSIRADYDGSVVSVIRRFLVQQRGALAGDGALEGCVPCEALFEVLISAKNALLVEPMVSDSSTVKGEDRVCHGDGEGALDSCVYAHLQVAMTAVFSIARERGGYLSDIFASVKVQKALEAMRQFFTSSNLFSSGSSSVSSTSEANGDSSSFLEDMLRETEVPRFVLGGALQRAAALLKDDVVTKLQRRRLCGGLSLEEALLACYLAEERITALTEIENLREEMVQPVTREALDLIDGAVRAFLKSEESEDFSAEATNHMKSSSFTTALAFLFTYVAAQTATETVGLPQDSTEHVRDALNVVAQTLLRRSVSQTSRFDVAQSNTAIDPESMQQSLRIIMDYAESQGYYPVTCDTSEAGSRSNHHCQYSQQTRRKDTPDIDVTKREALMEKMDSPRTTPRSSPHPRLSSPQEQRPQTSVVVVSQPNVTSHHINNLVHRGRMTNPVAIVMPDVMEDMQRRLTKELINCGTMTDGTISTNRATMTDLRSHSNCCTMTDPVAIVMPDVMEDMQRRLTKELINCGTMTDIRSHSNCCTMTDPVAIVMPDVMEDMQRRLTKELINCGTMTDGTISTNRATMTDLRSHSNCCTMTDPVAIVMPDVMEDMQRRLTKELINCGTMTDIRSHSNCCTMTDPVAIVMPDVMEDMQRRLTKELINCGTMTDIRSHSNCCTMTDPVAIVMPDVMEDMQRRLTKELINCGTMTDIRSHSNCCTMTDPVAIVMPDVMEDMQRRLTKELINCGTMTDIRSHSNCCTMTDPVAIVMPDVMEDMQRRLTKELINCGTMTDIRSHSNCCTMTDPVAIVMPDVMEDVQRRPSNRLDASTSLKVSKNNGDVAVYEAVRFGDEKVVVDSCSVASVSDSFPRDLSSEVGKLQLRVLDLGKEVYMLQKELMAREEQLQKTQERADYYKKNCETLENELAKLTEEQERNDARRTEAYTILEEESENLRAEIEALQKQLAEKPHKDASNSEALSNKNNTRKTDSDHAVDGKENLGLHHVSSVRSLVHLRENKAREHLRSRSLSNGREPPGGVLPTELRTWPQTAQQSAPAACTHEKGVERKLSEELDESDVVNHLTAQATPEMLNLKPELFVKNPASFDRLVSYLTRLVERAEREPGALSCEERHLSEVLKVFSTFYCGYRSIESGTGTCPIVDGNLRSRGGSSHSLRPRAKGMWSPESLRVSPDVGRNVDAVKEDQNGKHLGPVPSASTTFRTGRSERCTSSVRGVALVGGLLASRRRSSTAPSPTEGPRVPLQREEIEDLEGMSELVSSIEDMQSQLAYFNFSNEPELRESIKQLQQHLEELRAVLESQMSTTKMSRSPSYISSFRGSCFSQGNQQGQGVQEGKPPLKAESNGCQPATDSACDTNYSNGGQTGYLAVCNAVNTCCGGRGAFHRGSNRCSHWVPLRMHRANHDENVGLAMNEPGGSIPQGRSNAFDDGSQRKCMAPNRRNQSAVMRRLLDSMRFDLDSYVYTAAEQNAASAALLEESSSLKEREADMWLRLNQTEFCEMARIEMRLKRDDLRELQHEIHRMHLLHDKELVERKRRLLIYSYRKLLDFAKRMSDILKAREFCTGTLESQRLLLLDETSDFTKDVEKYIEVL